MLGLLFSAKALVGKALAWITASARNMLIVALVVVGVHDWMGWREAAKERKIRLSTEVAVRNAQADAEKAQQALNAAFSARSTSLAKESSHEHENALSGARTAVAAYARRMPACPKGAPGIANPAAVPDNPGVAAGGSEAPGMVAVTVADLDTLAAGTVRAESCRAWGQSLISAGLAEAD